MESSSFDFSSLSSTNFSDISTGGNPLAMAMKLRKMKGMKGITKLASSKGIAGGIISYLYCTPVKIYLCITLLLTILYIGLGIMKGKMPGISMICLMCCCISIGASVTGVLCQVYFGVPAWASVCLMTILGIIGIFTMI